MSRKRKNPQNNACRVEVLFAQKSNAKTKQGMNFCEIHHLAILYSGMVLVEGWRLFFRRPERGGHIGMVGRQPKRSVVLELRTGSGTILLGEAHAQLRI